MENHYVFFDGWLQKLKISSPPPSPPENCGGGGTLNHRKTMTLSPPKKKTLTGVAPSVDSMRKVYWNGDDTIHIVTNARRILAFIAHHPVARVEKYHRMGLVGRFF